VEAARREGQAQKGGMLGGLFGARRLRLPGQLPDVRRRPGLGRRRLRRLPLRRLLQGAAALGARGAHAGARLRVRGAAGRPRRR
jgi:hypothetical protein